MTTHPRDVVAVPDQSLIFNQPALKQVAVLFNRIALPALSRLPAMPEPHIELTEHLIPLADMGILFEPEIQKSDDAGFKRQTLHDIDELYKPAGLSAEDILASRTDEKKALEVKEKTRAINWESNSENDPYAMFRAIKRMVANTTRLAAIQLRNLQNLEALAVLSSEMNPLEEDDERPNSHDVLQILIPGLPLPDKDVSWEQIVEYRSDPNSLNRFLDLRNWINEIAHGRLTSLEADQRLEPVLKRFRKQAEVRQMKTVSTTLEAYVTTSPDCLRNLLSYPRGTRRCYFARRKLVLLEGEALSEVSEVAFVLRTSFLSDG
jgi:hypothetical protein